MQEFCVTRLNEDGRSLNEEVAFEIFDATGNDGPASLDFVDFGFDYNELVKKVHGRGQFLSLYMSALLHQLT